MVEREKKPYSDYFAYPSFRPEQDKMLDATWSTLQHDNKNSVLMVSAPTGSGKSSVISPALKYAKEHGMKVLVAVNTKSQISIFVEELERIRKNNQPNLTYSYLMGKSELCSCRHAETRKSTDAMSAVEKFLAETAGETESNDDKEDTSANAGGDVYEECRIRKRNSRTSMRRFIHRAEGMDSEDLIDYGYAGDEYGYGDKSLSGCPYYEMVYESDEGDYSTCILKDEAMRIVDTIRNNQIMPDNLLTSIPIDMCPYEVCLNAARRSDIVIVNYNHIVVDNVRDQLLNALGCSTDEIILIVDEAHNLGDRVRNTHMVNLSEDNIRRALEQVSSTHASQMLNNTIVDVREYMKTKFKDEDFNLGTYKEEQQLPFNIMELMSRFGDATCSEIDRINFVKECISEIDRIVGTDREIAKSMVGSTNMSDRESDLTSVHDFFECMRDAYFAQKKVGATHIGIVSISKSKRGKKSDAHRPRSVGIMNVDPSVYINQIVSLFYRTVMISGTLEPIDDYATIFFGNNASVDSVVLKNHFPAKNRAILCIDDVDSANKSRESSAMLNKYKSIISTFCEYIRGNVAIFGPSYKMRDVYCTQSDYHGKRLVVEPNSNYYPTRQKIDGVDCVFSWDCHENEIVSVDETAPAKATSMLIKEFKQFPELGIEGALIGVCGGKMSEGIDYKGDAMKGVLIVGFPYGAYNSVQKEIIRIYTNKYGDRGNFLAYTLPSLNKAVQAIGRLLRTETDTGVILLADKRFKGGIIRQGLPSWISSEMQSFPTANLKARLRTLSARGL